MRKLDVLLVLVIPLFVLPGLVNQVGAVGDIQDHRFVPLQYIDYYDAYSYSIMTGTMQYTDYDLLHGGEQWQYTETSEGFWAWQCDVTWYWYNMPTNGQHYYVRFYVAHIEEWMKVWFWDGSNWVYKTTLVTTGFTDVDLGTSIPSSNVWIRFVDAVPVVDPIQNTWTISRPQLLVYT